MSARRRRPDTVTLVKDLLVFTTGLALIIRQAFFVPADQVNIYLLILGGSLVGVPGVGQLLAPRTGGRLTPPEPPDSASSSRSSSPGAGADP